MEDKTMDELLKELASLIANQAPKEQILEKGWEIKAYLQGIWRDLGIAIAYIDSTINAFAPDPSWQNGLPTDKISITPATPAPSSSTTSPVSTMTITSIDHVLEVAKKVSSEKGLVETEKIVNQLRSDGDTRLESDMKKSIGNILARYGYERIYTGLYKLKNTEAQ